MKCVRIEGHEGVSIQEYCFLVCYKTHGYVSGNSFEEFLFLMLK